MRKALVVAFSSVPARSHNLTAGYNNNLSGLAIGCDPTLVADGRNLL